MAHSAWEREGPCDNEDVTVVNNAGVFSPAMGLPSTRSRDRFPFCFISEAVERNHRTRLALSFRATIKARPQIATMKIRAERIILVCIGALALENLSEPPEKEVAVFNDRHENGNTLYVILRSTKCVECCIDSSTAPYICAEPLR